VPSRQRTNVAGVTSAPCLARSATVRRRSRSDDGTTGPNSTARQARALASRLRCCANARRGRCRPRWRSRSRCPRTRWLPSPRKSKAGTHAVILGRRPREELPDALVADFGPPVLSQQTASFCEPLGQSLGLDIAVIVGSRNPRDLIAVRNDILRLLRSCVLRPLHSHGGSTI
jgi:hypothetical protein